MKLNGPCWEDSGTVTAGQSLVVELSDSGDVAVSISPGGGGTAQALKTCAPIADVRAGSSPAIFVAFAAATGTAANYSNVGPLSAIKIIATTADARYEIRQRKGE